MQRLGGFGRVGLKDAPWGSLEITVNSRERDAAELPVSPMTMEHQPYALGQLY